MRVGDELTGTTAHFRPCFGGKSCVSDACQEDSGSVAWSVGTTKLCDYGLQPLIQGPKQGLVT